MILTYKMSSVYICVHLFVNIASFLWTATRYPISQIRNDRYFILGYSVRKYLLKSFSAEVTQFHNLTSLPSRFKDFKVSQMIGQLLELTFSPFIWISDSEQADLRHKFQYNRLVDEKSIHLLYLIFLLTISKNLQIVKQQDKAFFLQLLHGNFLLIFTV